MKKLKQLSRFLSEQYSVEVVLSRKIKIAKLVENKIILNPKSRNHETELMFIVIHLFGHIIQSQESDKHKVTFENFRKLYQSQQFEVLADEIYAFELEAYQIGKGLLEMVFGQEEVSLLDERFQVYIEIDFSYFWKFLMTGIEISNCDFNEIFNHHYVKNIGNKKYQNELKSIHPPKILFNVFFSTNVY